jgi:hypothetical protein
LFLREVVGDQMCCRLTHFKHVLQDAECYLLHCLPKNQLPIVTYSTIWPKYTLHTDLGRMVSLHDPYPFPWPNQCEILLVIPTAQLPDLAEVQHCTFQADLINSPSHYIPVQLNFHMQGLLELQKQFYITMLWQCNLKVILVCRVSRDSSVGIATGYGLDDQGEREFESR